MYILEVIKHSIHQKIELTVNNLCNFKFEY